MRSIAGLFGKSPFGSLQAHHAKVYACVQRLRPLFGALIEGSDEQVTGLIKEICDLEHEADDIKNDLRDNLPRSLFLPAARSDLLVLLEVQDAIADAAQDAAILLRIRRIQVPQEFREDLLKLIGYAEQSCKGLHHIFEKLADLIEGSFRGKPAAEIFNDIKGVGQTEHQADIVAQSLLTRLFNNDGDLAVPELIIWDKLVGNLGRVSDLAEKAANRVRMLIAR